MYVEYGNIFSKKERGKKFRELAEEENRHAGGSWNRQPKHTWSK